MSTFPINVSGYPLRVHYDMLGFYVQTALIFEPGSIEITMAARRYKWDWASYAQSAMRATSSAPMSWHCFLHSIANSDFVHVQTELELHCFKNVWNKYCYLMMYIVRVICVFSFPCLCCFCEISTFTHQTRIATISEQPMFPSTLSRPHLKVNIIVIYFPVG